MQDAAATLTRLADSAVKNNITMTRIINPSNWQNLTTYVSGMLLAAIGIYGLVLTVINLA